MSEVVIRMLRSYMCPGKGLLDKGKHTVTPAQAEFLVNRGVAAYDAPPVPAPVTLMIEPAPVQPEPEMLTGPQTLEFVADVTEDSGGDTNEQDNPPRKRGRKGTRKYSSETPED